METSNDYSYAIDQTLAKANNGHQLWSCPIIPWGFVCIKV